MNSMSMLDDFYLNEINLDFLVETNTEKRNAITNIKQEKIACQTDAEEKTFDKNFKVDYFSECNQLTTRTQVNDFDFDFLEASERKTTKTKVLPQFYANSTFGNNECSIKNEENSSSSVKFGLPPLSKRIAKIDELVCKLKRAEEEKKHLEKQLEEFNHNVKEIQLFYNKEKTQRFEAETKNKALTSRCDELETELTAKSLELDQVKAQMDECNGPIPYAELATRYLKLAQKLEEERLLHWHDQTYVKDLTKFCKDKGLKIPAFTARSPRSPPKRKNVIAPKIDVEIQCDILTEDATNFKKPQVIQRNQATQCEKVKTRNQECQHIGSTTTRGTTTACFIKYHDVGTDCMPNVTDSAFHCVLEEMKSYGVVHKPLSPIPDISEPRKLAPITPQQQPLVFTSVGTNTTNELISQKTIGTCTYICNVQRQIDFSSQPAISIKRSDSRPPSITNLLYETVKDELTSRSHTSSPINMHIPALNNQSSTMLPNAFDELWKIFGHMLYGLLHRRVNGTDTFIAPNNITNQQEFFTWLHAAYNDLRPERNNCQQNGNFDVSAASGSGSRLFSETNVQTNPISERSNSQISNNNIPLNFSNAVPAQTPTSNILKPTAQFSVSNGSNLNEGTNLTCQKELKSVSTSPIYVINTESTGFRETYTSVSSTEFPIESKASNANDFIKTNRLQSAFKVPKKFKNNLVNNKTRKMFKLKTKNIKKPAQKKTKTKFENAVDFIAKLPDFHDKHEKNTTPASQMQQNVYEKVSVVKKELNKIQKLITKEQKNKNLLKTNSNPSIDDKIKVTEALYELKKNTNECSKPETSSNTSELVKAHKNEKLFENLFANYTATKNATAANFSSNGYESSDSFESFTNYSTSPTEFAVQETYSNKDEQEMSDIKKGKGNLEKNQLSIVKSQSINKQQKNEESSTNCRLCGADFETEAEATCVSNKTIERCSKCSTWASTNSTECLERVGCTDSKISKYQLSKTKRRRLINQNKNEADTKTTLEMTFNSNGTNESCTKYSAGPTMNLAKRLPQNSGENSKNQTRKIKYRRSVRLQKHKVSLASDSIFGATDAETNSEADTYDSNSSSESASSKWSTCSTTTSIEYCEKDTSTACIKRKRRISKNQFSKTKRLKVINQEEKHEDSTTNRTTSNTKSVVTNSTKYSAQETCASEISKNKLRKIENQFESLFGTLTDTDSETKCSKNSTTYSAQETCASEIFRNELRKNENQFESLFGTLSDTETETEESYVLNDNASEKHTKYKICSLKGVADECMDEETCASSNNSNSVIFLDKSSSSKDDAVSGELEKDAATVEENQSNQEKLHSEIESISSDSLSKCHITCSSISSSRSNEFIDKNQCAGSVISSGSTLHDKSISSNDEDLMELQIAETEFQELEENITTACEENTKSMLSEKSLNQQDVVIDLKAEVAKSINSNIDVNNKNLLKKSQLISKSTENYVLKSKNETLITVPITAIDNTTPLKRSPRLIAKRIRKETETPLSLLNLDSIIKSTENSIPNIKTSSENKTNKIKPKLETKSQNSTNSVESISSDSLSHSSNTSSDSATILTVDTATNSINSLKSPTQTNKQITNFSFYNKTTEAAPNLCTDSCSTNAIGDLSASNESTFKSPINYFSFYGAREISNVETQQQNTNIPNTTLSSLTTNSTPSTSAVKSSTVAYNNLTANSISQHNIINFDEPPASPTPLEAGVENNLVPAKEIPLELSKAHFSYLNHKSKQQTSFLHNLLNNYDQKNYASLQCSKKPIAEHKHVLKMKELLSSFIKQAKNIQTKPKLDSIAISLVQSLEAITNDTKFIAQAIMLSIEKATRPPLPAYSQNNSTLEASIITTTPIHDALINQNFSTQTHRSISYIFPYINALHLKWLVKLIETKIFNMKLCDKLALNDILNLIDLYLIVIRHQLGTHQIEENPARLFLAKIFYFYNMRAPPMIYAVLYAFPTILPHREERSYDRSDPLITVIQHQLMCTKYDMCNSELRNRELLSKLRFEYHFECFKPDFNDVLKNLMDKIRAGKFYNLKLAFAIFCKRLKMERLLNDVLKAHLIPLANEYYRLVEQSPVYELRLVFLLDCFSTVIRPLPRETTEIFDTDICSFLKSFFNLTERPCVQEAALHAILRLQRFDLIKCYKALAHLRLDFELKPHTRAALKSFIYRRPITFWKKLMLNNN